MLFRFRPFVAFKVDETAPGSVTPEPVAPEPTPAPQPGPWAADAAAYFGDNAEAVAHFDRYMREVQQPRMTQLEQSSAAAQQLIDDFQNDPDSTLQEVVAELYAENRPDLVEGLKALLAEEAAQAAPEPVTPPSADEPPEWAKPLIADHETRTEAQLRADGEAAYQEVLGEMREAHPDLTDADMNAIHPFMASASGDPDRAYAGYQQYKAELFAAYGVAPAAAPAPEAPTPPAVLGADGSTAAVPPVVENYKTFDDAWDAYQNERAVAAPPVVGSV